MRPLRMPLADYLSGLALLTAALALAAAAGVLAARRVLPALRGAERGAGAATLSLVALLAAHVVPAALGLLRPGWVLLAGALLLLGATRLPARPAPAADLPADPPPSSRAGWLWAMLAAAAFLPQLLRYVRERLDVAVTGVDALLGTLPTIAGFVRSGSLWRADPFDPGLAQANYPAHGTVYELAWILPWPNDALLRLTGLPPLALAGLALYALALRLGTDRATAVLVALLTTSIPIVVLPAVVAVQPDVVLVATFAVALLFGVRHHHTRDGADLAVAGLSLGVAFGTKWYGLPDVGTAIAVWVMARLVGGQARRGVLRDGVVVTATVLAVGGIWLVRNLVLTGNPLFPARLAPFGLELFPAPPSVIRDEFGFTIADYLGRPRVLYEQIRPALWAAVGPAGLALAAAVPAGVVLARRAPRGAAAGPALALALGAAVLAAVYTVTPDTALGPENAPVLVTQNARYGVPALLAAAGALAWVLARAPERARLALQAMLAASVIDATRRTFDPAAGLRGTLATAVAAAIVVALGLAAVVLTRRLRDARPGRHPAPGAPRRGRFSPGALGRSAPGAALTRRLSVGLAVALVLALVAAGHAQQRAFNEARYRGLDAGIEWLLARPAGQRVGVVGTVELSATVPVYPAYGPRLGNAVSYVGPLEQELLDDYRAPGPFLAEVRRRRLTAVVVGRGRPARPEVVQERWLRDAGYRQAARSPVLSVYVPGG